MHTEYDELIIKETIRKQLKLWMDHFFTTVDFNNILEYADEAYVRCLEAISASKDKYLKNRDGTPRFSMYHTGCWSVYLYYLSNSLAESSRGGAEQIYYLNKILHSVDWYYEVKLPKHFMVEHPLGSVLGRAEYGDYLYIYQGVTVGGNVSIRTGELTYPVLGSNVLMYSNSKVLGNSHIGNNVILSANAYVINEDIPDNSIVFGVSPDLVIQHNPESVKRSIERIWSKKNK